MKFKKFVYEQKYMFSYDKFNEDMGINKMDVVVEDPDTILVAAEEAGFKDEFLGNNRWYAVAIGINMLDKIKYIAVYQKSPVKAVTYCAEVANIDLYEDTGKYIIYFRGDAKQLKIPIPLNPKNPSKAPQGRVYTNIEKILTANSKTTLDDLF